VQGISLTWDSARACDEITRQVRSGLLGQGEAGALHVHIGVLKLDVVRSVKGIYIGYLM
jgi:hypothetical protein